MNLVMMGTGPFAAPLLSALVASSHRVLAVVTQPLRAGRADATPASPVRVLAVASGLPLLDPVDVNSPESQQALEALAPDCLVVADYGQILAPATLALARHGGVNLHGSLLPRYRGAAPINWAIYRGEPTCGVTVIQMTPRVDAGPTLARAETPIGASEDAVALECRLAALGAPLIVQALDALEAGTLVPLPQSEAQATPARRLRKSDGRLDWSRDAQALFNQIRALEPWPRTYTWWQRSPSQVLRLIPRRVAVVDERTAAAAGAPVLAPAPTPGVVVETSGPNLLVATGRGLLALQEIQPAGKRSLSAEEFLRGYPVRVGDRLLSDENG